MKDHGGFPTLAVPIGIEIGFVAVLGATTNPPVAPVDGSVQPNFPKKANMLSRVAAEIPARSGVGAYTIQYDLGFQCPKVLFCDAAVYGTTGTWPQISAVNQVTRTITVKTFGATGTPTDLAATDLLVCNIWFQNSNA